jgi:hypothetical protein
MREAKNLPSVIETAQERDAIKIWNIAYENSLPQTNKSWVFDNLSDKREIVKFLKDMLLEMGVLESAQSFESAD